MEFMSTANELIVLLPSFLGLVGTGIGVFFAIKNWFKATKEKTKAEQWALIMEMADAAMKVAEKSGMPGLDKKDMVIEAVKASTLAAGLDFTVFLDQLSNYIDSTIKFVNEMKK
jgi:hypothetical protein